MLSWGVNSVKPERSAWVQVARGIVELDGQLRLLIADRGNHRIAVYDDQGRFQHAEDEATHSPCMFDVRGDELYVPELFAEVKVLDSKLQVQATLGSNFGIHKIEGWPNFRKFRQMLLAGPATDPYVAQALEEVTEIGRAHV